MDYGSTVADKAVGIVTKKIRKAYRQAAQELKEKLAEFNKRFAEKQKKMLKMLEDGEITERAYGNWLRDQVFMSNAWSRKADQAVRIMRNANMEASKVVKDGRLNVFAENYNFSAYELEKSARGAINFQLYNEKSVAKLIKEKPKMLPEWKINEKKDYLWNRKKVENSITQGIIQGKRIDEITDDLINNLCSTNENKMKTFARTAITGAQNAGRQAQMEDAEEEGIKVKKKWVATLDNRTRDTHADLDGQEVAVNEPFEVKDDTGSYEIMFPGDPNADPCMVYNCRCTMIQVYEGIERKSVRRAYYDEDDEEYEKGKRKSYTVENMTYNEWKKWKERGRQ